MSWRFVSGLTAAILTCAPSISAAQAPIVRITGISPESGTLRPYDVVGVRVEYESGQPLQFQARGRLAGREVENARMNPSPTYPAGKSEAIAWVAFEAGVRIDEIEIVVSDGRWRELSRMSAPANVEWVRGAAEISRPRWVRELYDAQQRAVDESMRGMAGVGGLVAGILPLLFLLALVYPVLQIVAWRRLTGRARTVSALPMVLMVPVYTFSAFALIAGANLWPMGLIFLSPPAAVFVGIVLLVGRSRTPDLELQR